MATILAFRPPRSKPSARIRAAYEAPAHFADLLKQFAARLDWSEATAEDEYDAALAAFDIVCGRPASRRSRAA